MALVMSAMNGSATAESSGAALDGRPTGLAPAKAHGPSALPTVREAKPIFHALEQWTARSHAVSRPDGSTLLTIFASPQFIRTARGWRAASGVLSRGAAPTPVHADQTLIPLGFGSPAGPLLTLRTPQGPLIWSLPSARSSSSPTVSGQNVIYRNIAASTDLEYAVQASQVKEQFVLRSVQAPTSFVFLLADPGHRLGQPLRMADESWAFGKAVSGDYGLRLEAPSAWEQTATAREGGQGSAHQRVTVTRQGYLVSLSVDPSWLRGRKFPIVLDPTISFTTQPTTMGYGEAPISGTACSGAPCPVGHGPFVVADGYNSTYGTVRGFIQQDLTPYNIPPTVTSASVTLTSTCTQDFFEPPICNQVDKTIQVHEMSRPMVFAGQQLGDYGPDLAAATLPSVIAQDVIHNYISRQVTNVTTLDVTASLNRFIAQGRASSVAWALESGFESSDPVVGSAVTLSITYLGDASPAAIGNPQTYGCGCDGNAGPNVVNSVLDPIRTNSGSPVEAVRDLEVTAPGQHVAWTRTYNGADATVGAMGAGWTTSFASALTQDLSTGNVTVRDGGGGLSRFVKQTDGSFLPDPGITAQLVAVAGGWTLTTPSQEKLTFNAAGQPTSDVNAQGIGVTFAYAAGKLATLTDAVGQATTLTYGTVGASTGLITVVSAPDGRTVHYGYTAVAGASRLTSVVSADGQTTTIGYDPTTGQLNAVTDPDLHASAQNTFDPSTGRVTAQKDAAGAQTTLAWSPTTHTETVTDPLGRAARDVYSSASDGSSGNVLVDHFDALGARTHYSYDSNLNIVAVTDPLGRVTQMTYDASGNMLTRTAPAPLNYVESWTYDGANRLLTHSDGRHNTTTYTYTPSGQVSTVTDPTNGVTTYTYNANHQVATVKDPLNRVTTYAYDSVGNLTGITSPLSELTTMTYDSAHRLLTRTDPRGNVVGCNCAAAYTTHWTYDGAGRPLTQTDPLGHVTTNTYDVAGNRTAVKDANNKTTTYSFDPDNRLLTTTDPLNHVTTNVWDSVGQLTSTTTATGAKTTYTYDSDGHQLTVTAPNGNVSGASQATHDAYTTTYTYDAAGNRLTESTPDPAHPGSTLITNWAFDELNRVVKTTDAALHVTLTSYDQVGNQISTVDPAGATTNYGFDNDNRANLLIDPNGHSTSTTYDLAGNATAVTDGQGGTTTFGYNADERRTSSVEARGNATGGVPSQYTTTLGYDPAGNQTTVTDPLAEVTTKTYNALNQVVSVKNPRLNITQYTYDNVGRLLTVKDPTNAVTTYGYDAAGNKTSVQDPRLHTTSYTYDADNRLASRTSPTSQLWTYGYDADANRTSVVTPKGNAGTLALGTVSATYDTLDRPTLTTYGDGTPSVSLTYDSGGHVSQLLDGRGTLAYGYDADGRVLSLTRNPGAAQQAFTYVYDGAGNITNRTYPDGTAITETYDGLNHVTSLSPSASALSANYLYDAAGNLTSTLLPGGVSAVRTYDKAGRLTQVANTKGSTVLSKFTETLDADANPTTIVTLRGSTSSTTIYQYDNDDRTTKACFGTTTCTGSTTNVTYAYDANGNQATQARVGLSTPGTTTYTYDNADHLTTTKIGTTTTGTYTYDSNGNQATLVTSAGTMTTSYNLAEELVSSTVPGSPSTTVTYAYDGLGERTTRTVNGTLDRNYLWDTQSPLPKLAEETSATGSLLRRYINDPYQTIGTTTPAGDATMLLDPQSNVTDLATTTGTSLGTYSYEPFGVVRTSSGTDSRITTNPLKFASQYMDSTSGLYDMRARDYNPAIGRFTALDPLASSQSGLFVSGYTYVGDKSMRFGDPSGRGFCDDLFGLCDSPSFLWNEIVGAKNAAGELLDSLGHPIRTYDQLVAACNAGFDQWSDAGASWDGFLQCVDNLNPVAGVRRDLAQSLNTNCIPQSGQAFGHGLFNGGLIAAGGAGSAVADATGFELVGDGAATRVVNYRPDVSDPNWGLSRYHLDKHLFGSGKYSLRQIDPGGNTDVWFGYMQELAGRDATSTLKGGIEDIIGVFPKTGGGGTFRFGIRIAPHGDGSWDLVTLLTGQ